MGELENGEPATLTTKLLGSPAPHSLALQLRSSPVPQLPR